MSTPMTTPKEALELKPCPFCGKPPVLLATHETDRYIRKYEVRCDNCGIGMSEEYESSAAELWNTRVTASLEGDAVERVARMIEPYCPKAHVQYKAAVVLAERILATGLVADEAAIRAAAFEEAAKIVTSRVEGMELQRFVFNGVTSTDTRGNDLFIAKSDVEKLLNDRAATIRSGGTNER